jgi:hypothetical protein
VRFFAHRPHAGHGTLIQANSSTDEPDLLFIFDSRAISRQFDGSLAQLLIDSCERRSLSYVIICRPLELTTWATVLGFFQLNDVRPAKLVTNVGFVDFTPKKLEILQDAIDQVDAAIGRGGATAVFVEETTRLNGEVIRLYANRYADLYRQRIEALVSVVPTVVINSPPVSPVCVFERSRPPAFYSGLEEGNAFNRRLAGINLIELPVFDDALTYDAVHHTTEGCALVFDRVQPFL